MNKFESKYFNTAKKMDDALVSLLEKKDFDYITVKDICNEAKVNRSTFYLHYDNTLDVLNEVIENVTKSFDLHFSQEKANDILSKDESELFLITDKYLIPYLQFIYKNQKIYKAIQHNGMLFKADKTYNKMYKEIFLPIILKKGGDEKYSKYIMTYFMNGISSILLAWCEDNCKLSIEEMCALIKGLINDK